VREPHRADAGYPEEASRLDEQRSRADVHYGGLLNRGRIGVAEEADASDRVEHKRNASAVTLGPGSIQTDIQDFMVVASGEFSGLWSSVR